MKKIISVIVLAAILGLGAPSARAGIVYLGVQGGISRQKASLSGLTFDTDTTFVYGAKAGVKFMMFAAELNYFQAAHDINAQDLSLAEWRNRSVDYNYIGVNLKWFFPILIVQPYLTAGYGYYTADIKNIDKDKNGGWNAGAGVEIMLGKTFALTAEGKYHHVKLDINNQNFKLGDFTLMGGISLYF
jgi:opacity protein-like surface antigen